MVHLPPPEREVRQAVIERLLGARYDRVDAELAGYLAGRPAESVRAVQAFVQRVEAAADARHAEPDVALAREVLEGAAPRAAAPRRGRAHEWRRGERVPEPREGGLGVAGHRRAPDRGVALMAIKGSLKEASLPDVIQLLALGRKTGCLAVADRQNFGYIYFDDGRIIFASIVNRRDRLGDLLVRSGRISDAQLRAAVDRQAGDRDRKLGEILVELGYITRAELEDHIRVQVEEAVYYLFTWSSGTFNFEAGVRPEREDFLVSINPESLLLEGARRVDEWSLIAKKIPTLDIVFEADQARLQAAGVRLSDEQEASCRCSTDGTTCRTSWTRPAWSSSRSARPSTASSPRDSSDGSGPRPRSSRSA